MPADNPSDDARTRVVDNDAPQALRAGTLLGRYRIDSVLGHGGFGITYQAIDTSLDRPVAIKEYLPLEIAIRVDGSTVVPRSRKDNNDYEWGLTRFLDEAKMLARHEAVPNMVRVYDFIEANGTAYMVMALATGENLATILRRRGPLSEAELKAIALPLLNGLQHLHQAGLVHRDIKPANIILSPSGVPTLIDFGAARQSLGRLSRSITSIVTPGYAPFEQYGSAGEQGPWTDIYALAATLYHGVTGKPPPDSADRIRRDPMVPAVQSGAGRYSEQFLAAIDAGLRIDERERPQTAEQWRNLFVSELAVSASPIVQPTTIPQPGRQQPAVQMPVAQTPDSRPAPSERLSATVEPRPQRGSRKLLIAAGIAVLLIGGGAAVALMSGGSREPAADQASVQLAETEKKRAAELEKKLAAEAESRKKLEAQVAEAEAKRKAEEEARRKAAEEAQLKAEAEAREKAEAENRRRIEEDTRKKVEAEFKARAEEEARKRQADEEIKRKAETEARRKADEEAKRVADAEAKRKAEEEARRKAEQKPAANPAQHSPEDLVKQHWPTMKANAESFMARKGSISHPQSGLAMRFSHVHGNYKFVSLTPATITLDILLELSTVQSGATMPLPVRAVFRNETPGFPVVRID